MASWARRVHRRAADLGSVVTSCGHPGPGPYPYRLEKVKFGVPLTEVCKNDIPGPLLVLILKVNKEGPNRRDVFRAPGHQGAMKKLIHLLQAGRLVNIDHYSVHTIASVLKKFLRKIPNGIFGRDGEAELFAIVDLDNEYEQQERINRLIMTLPIYTQHLLVLLFGTFRVIASNADRAFTGMSSEALGVSVAPSFFQSCVSDGKTARMDDVLRFKVATRIMKQMIDQFADYDLFGRDNYDYYTRITGRVLKVEDEWICSFQYPPQHRGRTAQQNYAVQLSLEAGKTWLQCECDRLGLIAQEESQSTPLLLTSSSSAIGNSNSSLGIIPEQSLLESCARLSVSLEGPGVFAMPSSSASSQPRGPKSINLNGSGEGGSGGDGNNDNDENGGENCGGSRSEGAVGGAATAVATTSSGDGSGDGSSIINFLSKLSSSSSSAESSPSGSTNSHQKTMDELKAVNRYAESTKSLSYLPQVHERQTARMRTRSEWFLGVRGSSLEYPACENYHHYHQYNYYNHHLYHQQYFSGSTNDIPEHSNLTNNTFLLSILQYHQQQEQLLYQQQQQQQHKQQQQQKQHRMVTDMITSADDKDNERCDSDCSGGSDSDVNTGIGSITTNQGNPMMLTADTNLSQISVDSIGISANAETVHYPYKSSSRRDPNMAQHHPHHSSLQDNKENDDNKYGASTSSGGIVVQGDTSTISGGIPSSSSSSSSVATAAIITSVNNNNGNGGGSNSLLSTITSIGSCDNIDSSISDSDNTIIAPIIGQSHHSNSFRQKKSNSLMIDCSASVCSGSKLREPRAVSFELSPSTSRHHPTVATKSGQLYSKIGLTSLNKSGNNLKPIIRMNTTSPPSSASYHHHQHRHNNHQEQDHDITIAIVHSISSTTTETTTKTTESPSSSSTTSSSSSSSVLHFKPPRV